MMPAWIIGSAVASFVFMLEVQMAVPALGLPGLVLTPLLAIWAGTAAASVVNARRSNRDVVIIAVVVLGLLVAFLWAVQTRVGVQGGPNI